MEEDALACEIESVGSCESNLRDEADTRLESLCFEKIYMNTHAGSCLQTVLRGLMAHKQINVVQKSELEMEFNRIYHAAFSHCQTKLHVNVHAKLNEYASVETGSVFQIQDCVVTGPSSSVQVPKGEAKLVFVTKV